MLDGRVKFLFHNLLGSVERQVEQVEAGVSDGEVTFTAAGALNDEMQRLHAHDRDTVRSGQEEEKLLLGLQRQLVEDFPENPYGGMIGRKIPLERN